MQSQEPTRKNTAEQLIDLLSRLRPYVQTVNDMTSACDMVPSMVWDQELNQAIRDLRADIRRGLWTENNQLPDGQ